MTRKEQHAIRESNWIRGLLAAMVLIGCASTHVQNLALERQLEEDKRMYAVIDQMPDHIVAKL